MDTLKKCLRWICRRWKWLSWAVAVLICLLFLGVFLHGDSESKDVLTDQNAYARWETEEKTYAQASVYLRETDALSQESLYGIRMSVETALTAGGVPSEDYPWYFAASRTENAVLSGDDTSTNVELTLITGEYFRIHPMEVRSGWYMEENDVMHDRIILDYQTAWELFSSDNVAGQYVELNGQRYQVAAVVDYPAGKYNEMAAGGTNRAWVYGDSPGVTAGTDGENTEPVYFTTLEMVLPQPVKDFAVSTLQSAVRDLVPEDTVYTDNSGRFSLKNRWNVLRSIGVRGISSKGILYPWYENAAMLTENHLALRLIPEAIFLGIPLISLILLLLWLNHRRTWGLHSIHDAIESVVERKRTRDYEARLRGEEPKRRRKH